MLSKFCLCRIGLRTNVVCELDPCGRLRAVQYSHWALDVPTGVLKVLVDTYFESRSSFRVVALLISGYDVLNVGIIEESEAERQEEWLL